MALCRESAPQREKISGPPSSVCVRRGMNPLADAHQLSLFLAIPEPPVPPLPLQSSQC